MEPLELIFEGIPISQRASRQELHSWRDYLRTNAEKQLLFSGSSFPDLIELSVRYFYETSPAASGDITKPIIDALIGLLITNYNQIIHVDYQQYDLYGTYIIPDISPTLIKALIRSQEMLYVKITPLEDETTLIGDDSEVLSMGYNALDHDMNNQTLEDVHRDGLMTPESMTEEFADIPPFLKDKRIHSQPNHIHDANTIAEENTFIGETDQHGVNRDNHPADNSENYDLEPQPVDEFLPDTKEIQNSSSDWWDELQDKTNSRENNTSDPDSDNGDIESKKLVDGDQQS